jgi:hypothetical protein
MNQLANGRTTVSFTLRSKDGTYHPALGAEVLIDEDATRIFGGLVQTVREAGVHVSGGTTQVDIEVTAIDFNVYAERRFFAGTLAAGTLKSQLQTLIPLMSAYGVTLHASQVNGPTMPALTYDYANLVDIFNEQAVITADAGEPFVWRTNASKVFRMYQPSTTAAPFNLVGADLVKACGDIVVETTRNDYANTIILRAVPKREDGRVETFVGDGVTTTFTLEYTLIDFPYGLIHRFESDGITPDGGETLGIVGTTPVQWEYDPATNQIERLAGPTDATKVYKFTFNGLFTGTWTAVDAADVTANGITEKVISVESIPSDTTGQQMADAELAKRLYPTKRIDYPTWEPGLEVGQSQTITTTTRNLNVAAVISEIYTRDVSWQHLIREVTAFVDAAQTNLGRGWIDTYRIWDGDKTGTGLASVGAGGGASNGPGNPDKSVQFNRLGAFGGDASFTYDEATNSVIGGLLSSITASNPESCQAWGNDSHIADP